MFQLFFDLFPVIIFFGAYQFTKNIILATAVLMASMLVQFILLKIMKKPIQKMHWISLILVLVLGGATVIFQDKSFIQWKPSVLNWILGLVLLISPLFGGKSLIERLMSASLELPKKIYSRLNIAWATFFILMGFLNLWIFTSFDEQTWVNFKLFGILGLTLVFVILQGVYLSKFLPEETLKKLEEQQNSSKNKI